MFRRKIYDALRSWKDAQANHRQALIIKGLRQVGKTFIARRFAEDNYRNVVYINFKANDSAKQAFKGDFDVDRLTLDLSALSSEFRFVPHETVIILDEIQDCAEARASLKYIVEDGRYDVMCTGSLLGIKGYNRTASRGVSVGSEHTLYLKAMDFEEFLWAKGVSEDVIAHVRTRVREKGPVSDIIHETLMRHFHEYICVGGMPAVVETFVRTHDLNQVQTMQRDILESYRDDFAKHLDENGHEETDRTLLARINAVFESIPAQLAKENKKFQYSKLGRSARGNQYDPAIQWLCDYGLVTRCTRLNSMERPLEGNADPSVFKLYFRDTGLFTSMLEKGTASAILNGELGAYKGAIFENIVADAFSKCDRGLHYHAKASGVRRMGISSHH
ncbi:MAG: AAA family ATPase, partial [archaeon]|nr:AAA family ATPase [archaeon]